jgi:hypothetical protein
MRSIVDNLKLFHELDLGDIDYYNSCLFPGWNYVPITQNKFNLYRSKFYMWKDDTEFDIVHKIYVPYLSGLPYRHRMYIPSFAHLFDKSNVYSPKPEQIPLFQNRIYKSMANIGIPPKGGIQIEGIDVDVNLDSKDDILSGAILNIPYRTKTFPKEYYLNEEKAGVSFRTIKKTSGFSIYNKYEKMDEDTRLITGIDENCYRISLRIAGCAMKTVFGGKRILFTDIMTDWFNNRILKAYHKHLTKIGVFQDSLVMPFDKQIEIIKNNTYKHKPSGKYKLVEIWKYIRENGYDAIPSNKLYLLRNKFKQLGLTMSWLKDSQLGEYDIYNKIMVDLIDMLKGESKYSIDVNPMAQFDDEMQHSCVMQRNFL